MKNEESQGKRLSLAGNTLLSHFLFKLTGKRLALAVIATFVITVIPFIVSIEDGNFINSSLGVDALHDYGNIMLYVFCLPITLLSISLYFNRFPKVMNSLQKDGIIIVDSDEWEDYIEKSNKSFSNKKLLLIPTITSLVVTVLLVLIYMYPAKDCWYCLKHFYLAALLQIVVYLITYFVFSLAIVLIFNSYKVLKGIFEELHISVQALHPDNCGGLASLGKLSKALNLSILFFGFTAATNIYQNTILFVRTADSKETLIIQVIFQIVIVLFYLINAYIVFFIPLKAAHKSMKSAKFNEIDKINKYFIRINEKVKKSISEDKIIDENLINSLSELKILYENARKMPVYPFDIKTLSYFFSSILLPTIILLIEFLLKRIFQ